MSKQIRSQNLNCNDSDKDDLKNSLDCYREAAEYDSFLFGDYDYESCWLIKDSESEPMPEQKNKNAYEIVLDYLFQNKIVETVEEANYLMLEMKPATIKSIVSGMPTFIDPNAKNEARKKQRMYGSKKTE
jgi:hypothetical protein